MVVRDIIVVMGNDQSFKFFLGRTWWFLLIALSHAFTNSQKSSLTGSTMADIFVSAGIILGALYVYWFIKYEHKKL